MRGLICGLSVAMVAAGASAGPPWSESFDAYPEGPLAGLGGWEPWDGDIAAADFQVSAAEALSAPHAVAVNGADDAVRTFEGHTSGQLDFTVRSFVPLEMLDVQFFILMNTYPPEAFSSWSLQLGLDGANGELFDADSEAALPLIKGEWAEIHVEIDLDLDQQSVFYNGAHLVTKSWTAGNVPGGAVNVAAVDLWANGSVGTVFYDDFVLDPLPAGCAGDVNGDQVVGVQDLIDVIVQWGPCPGCPADLTGDGVIGVLDLIEVLLNWGPCPPAGGCGDPASGSCFAPGPPGCDDPACCEPVCAVDPYCCEADWDIVCVDRAVVECGGSPAISIIGHDPPVIGQGTVVTVFGDGFPLDRADLDLNFYTPEGLSIPVDDLAVVDDDGDGHGELVHGVIGIILPEEANVPLHLEMEFYDGDTIPLPDLPGVEAEGGVECSEEPLPSPDDGVGEADEVPPPPVEEAKVRGGFVEGDDPAANAWKLPFEDADWEAGSVYRVTGKFWIKYCDTMGTEDEGDDVTSKRHYVRIREVELFPTDEDATMEECLDRIVEILNEVLEAYEGTPRKEEHQAESSVIADNFEWVRNGDSIELKRKADADPDIVLKDLASGYDPVIEVKQQ